MSDDQKNVMTYNGNHIFHYTSLNAAIKIILSNSLRFGEFANMNDIAESYRDLLDNIDSKTLRRLLSEYRSISLTEDTSNCERGFAIDCLWGYYAEKGQGVCLVFDKEKLFTIYEQQQYACKGVPKDKSIEYEKDYQNLVIAEGKTEEEIRRYVECHISEIFYKKNICWSYEKEIRLLAKSKDHNESCYLPLGDSLIAAIICVQTNSYKESEQYKLLSKLKAACKFSVYNYSIELGKRTLQIDDDIVWPISGVDEEIDLDKDND